MSWPWACTPQAGFLEEVPVELGLKGRVPGTQLEGREGRARPGQLGICGVFLNELS